MNILITICGRAGSKGIRNKNIRNFLEYPLPYYTVAAVALYRRLNRTDIFDVAVNTDSEELTALAAANPFVPVEIIRREAELAGDTVAKTAVIQNTLQQMEAKTGRRYDMVVDLDLTSPLRKVEDLQRLIETQKNCRADVTFSVTDARRNPYFNMVMQTEHGYRKVLPSDFMTRQQAPTIYDMNASMYAYRPDFLRTGQAVLDGYCEIIHMEDTAVLDLDHENDLELMQVIARHLFKTRKEFAEVYECIGTTVRTKAELLRDEA